MSDGTPDFVIDQLRTILHEAFEGSPTPWSYFTDGPRDTALLGTLDGLSAAEASRPVAGSSVAAHVYHIQFGMRAWDGFIRGERVRHDWAESWKVQAVDDAAWTALRDDLRAGYADLRCSMEEHAGSGAESFGGAVGAIAHVAYHLGAIRQKLAVGRTAPA